MIKKLFLIFGVFFCLWGFTSFSQAVVDRIVAVVNQEIITLSEVETRLNSLREESEDGDRLEKRQQIYEVRRRALDQIIDEKLIDQEAQKAGIKVSGKEVDAAIEEIRRRNNVTLEEMEQALKKEGLTLETFKKQVEKSIQRSRLIHLAIKVDSKPGEKELRDFFQKNLERYRSTESYRASHIFFHFSNETPTETNREIWKKAQMVLGKIKGGADFAEMALLYSDDVSSKDGGDLGYCKRGELLPAFEKEALRLQIGEISGIVRTDFGLHIIKLTDRKSGTSLFEEIREKVQGDYYEKEMEKALMKYLITLKGKAVIEIKL